MPELPEVENVRLSLLPYLPGRIIDEVKVHHPKVLVKPEPEDFLLQLRGERFESLERLGKQLIFKLRERVLLVHLGMTGQLTFRDPSRADTPFERHPTTGLERALQHPVDAHTHISLYFGDGCALHYRDQRKFGKWRLVGYSELDSELSRIGVDPLSPDWNERDFAARVKSSARAVKAIILDQLVSAGVGNIYADEALFMAGIRPQVQGCRLSEARIKKLFRAIPEVLLKGLAAGGTTFSNYVNADGVKGSNQEKLFVYGRFGYPCLVCGTTLQRSTVAQRTSTWCPRCQRP